MTKPYDPTCRLAFLGHRTEKDSLEALSKQVAVSSKCVFSIEHLEEYRAFAPDYCVLYPTTPSTAEINSLITQASECSSRPKIVLFAFKQNLSRFETVLQKGISLKVIRLDTLSLLRAADLLVSFLMLENEIKPPDEKWEFIGNSSKVHEIHDLIDHFARFGKDPVLITGETGTGKELIARRLHDVRNKGEFRPYNAAAFPFELCVSLLCGSRKGSFTDSMTTKGYIMEAGEGTLFIDEIGDVQPAIQVILLRILQDKRVVKLGDDASVFEKTKARFVFATNRDLKEALRTGAFREDLLQRINALQIEVPPLRKRVEDIPLLVRHFVREFVSDYRETPDEKTPSSVNQQALATIDVDNVLSIGVLSDYDWPGNVRELRNAVRRAAAMTREGPIDEHLAMVVEEKLSERTKEASLALQFAGRQRDRDAYVFLNSLLNDTRDDASDRFKKAYDQDLFLRTNGDNSSVKFLGDVGGTTVNKVKNLFNQLHFKRDDLINAESLTIKLKQRGDPVSKYIHGKLLPRTRQMLDRYSGETVDFSLLDTLTNELNRILQDRNLSQTHSVHRISLSEEVRRLIERYGWWSDLFLLNRRIIEDAYPAEILKRELMEGPKKDKGNSRRRH